MIRESIHQEYKNIYALNNRVSKCVKNKLFKIEGKNRQLKIVRYFKTAFLTMGRTTIHKVNWKRENLNNTTNQLGLIVIYKTFHPQTAKYALFSSVRRTYPRIYHILTHKTGFNKLKRVEIIQNIFQITVKLK